MANQELESLAANDEGLAALLDDVKGKSDEDAVAAYLDYFKAEGIQPEVPAQTIEREPTGFEQFATASQNMGEAGLSVFADLVDAAGVVMGIAGSTGEEALSLENKPAQALGRVLRGAIAAPQIDTPPEAENFFTGPVASGLGSAGGFIAGGGVVGRALGLGGTAATALTGASTGGVQEYFEAKAGGASEERALAAFLVGAGVGMSEAVPLAGLFSRADKASGGSLKRVLLSGMMGALREAPEEVAQESFQTVASNAIARWITENDPDRKLLEGVVEQGAVGGIVGAILGGAVSTAGAIRQGVEVQEKEPTQRVAEPAPQEEQAVSEAASEDPPVFDAVEEAPAEALAAEEAQSLPADEPETTATPQPPQEEIGDIEAGAVAIPRTEEEVAQWGADRGVDVEFRDEAPFDGLYDNGKVILKRGTQDPMRALARHELTHRLATGTEEDQAVHRQLTADLREFLGDDIFQSIVDNYAQRRSASGLPEVESLELAEEEGVGDTAQILTGYLDYFAENPEQMEAYARGDRTRWQRFVDFVKGLLSRAGINVPTSLERLGAEIEAGATLTEAEQGLPRDAAIRSAVAIGNALDSLLGRKPQQREAMRADPRLSPALNPGLKARVASFREEIAGQFDGVEIWLSLSRGQQGPVVVVDSIVVPKVERNKGTGSAIMEQVVAFADREGIQAALTPSSDFGGSVPRLRRFYSRFGFRRNKGRRADMSISEAMIRDPKGAPRFSPSPPVDSEPFRRWFGDSKVVDENGQPLVVYHGTPTPAFAEFEPRGLESQAEDLRRFPQYSYPGAFYFASSPVAANFFATRGPTQQEQDDGDYSDKPGGVLPVFVSLQNPYESIGGRITPEDVYEAKARGHDGVVGRRGIIGVSENSVEFVAFDNTQIKSAIGNVGTFDATNPDIRFSPAGEAQAAVPQAAEEAGVPEQDVPVTGGIGNYLAKFSKGWRPYSEVIANKFAYVEALGIPELTETLELVRGKAKGQIDTKVRRVMKELEPLLAKPSINQIVRKGDGRKLTRGDDYAYVSHAPERNSTVLRTAQEANAQLQPEIDRVRKLAEKHAAAGKQDLADKAYERLGKLQRRLVEEKTDGSGISTGSAKRSLAAYNRGPYAEDLKRYRQLLKELNQIKLEAWAQSGLIEADTLAALKKAYQWYVPLKHIEEDDGSPLGIGRGVDIRGAEFRRATGRKTLPEHILPHLLTDVVRAVVRSEKAPVGQIFLEYADDIDGFEVDRVETVVEIGDDGVSREVVKRDSPLQDNVLAVRKDGQMHLISAQTPEAQKVIDALNGSNVWRWHDTLRPVADFAGGILRGTDTLAVNWPGLTKLATSYNPAFVPINWVRDTGQGVATAAEFGLEAWDIVNPKKIGSAVKILTKTYLEIRDGKPISDPVAKEYIESGAPVSFLDQRGLPQSIAEVNKLARGKTPAARALDYINRLGALVDLANQVVENITRFNVYRGMRENGAPVPKAASGAKNVSVNFERGGTAAPIFGVGYMFANAGIQGNARLLRALKHPRVRRAMAAYVSFSAILAMWNRFMAGEDDEGVPLWDKVSPWEKTNNLMVYVPWISDEPFKVPLTYGLNVLHAIPTATMDAIFGNKSAADASHMVYEAALNSFNPFGGDAALQDMLMPDQLDPFFQVQDNRAWWGGQIHPDKRGVPDSMKSWPETADFWKNLAESVNEATGGNSRQSGMVDVSPESIKYLFEQAFGGTGKFLERTYNVATNPTARTATQIPVLRRFFGTSYDRADRESYYDNRNAVLADIDAKKEGKEGDFPLARLEKPLKSTKSQLDRLKKARRSTDDEAEKAKIRSQELQIMRRFSAQVRGAR